ncbi:MAG: hypothetical protein U0521_13060 [Anaerolineae bacterium]
MPVYEYRCNVCGRKAALFYKTYKGLRRGDRRSCPDLPPLRQPRPDPPDQPSGDPEAERDYSTMSSDEMLSVMEGGL